MGQMSNFVSGPNTYGHVRWSAQAFRELADDGLGIAVRAPGFSQALLQNTAPADWPALVKYVNQWGCRIPQSKADGIAAAVGAIAPQLAPLAASALEFDDLRCSTLGAIESAFDGLTDASGIGPTAASAILTALNPQLFVSWSGGIKAAYFPNDPPSGATYGQFLSVMRMAAFTIAADARNEHGIVDPAGRLSEHCGVNPPFSLAKFIDEYNWLTLERGLAYQPETVAV